MAREASASSMLELVKSLGALLLSFHQWRDARRYRALLNNGHEVYRQNCLSNSGDRASVISMLDFRDGHRFRIRDGLSAAHTFYEIFLEDQYPGRFLRDAQLVVDVGANIGLFSYYARKQARGAKILAFEADPATFPLLSENLGAMSIDCFPCAVASFEGEIEFYSSPVSGWSSLYPVMGAAGGRKVTIPTVVLSRFLKQAGIERVDFLKIDVEGAEYDILLGDAELLELDIGCLAVEVDRAPRDRKYEYGALLARLREKFPIVDERTRSADFPLLIGYRRPFTTTRRHVS